MDSLDREVLEHASRWLTESRHGWLVTVLETWGSAPRPAGALLAIRDDGVVVGSVSGGCIEDDLIDRVMRGERISGPSTVVYGVDKEEAARFGLPCGGTIRLLQEPLATQSWIDDVLDRTSRHELVTRELNLESGVSVVRPSRSRERFFYDGSVLRSVFGPKYRLFVVGAGQLSRLLGEMAQAVDFKVTVCDPREEYYSSMEWPQGTLLTGMPDDEILSFDVDANTAIVALTHDPKLDDMALLEALKSPAFYVGAIGSRRNTMARKKRLAEFDLSEQEIDRLHGPIGLHIGSRIPAEIAVSVLAEIVSVKNGVSPTQKKPMQPSSGFDRAEARKGKVGEETLHLLSPLHD